MTKKPINPALPAMKHGKWQIEDHAQGSDCREVLLFRMVDQDHEFSLPLSVVLNCLWIAEKEGYVPKLPEQWKIDVENAY